MHSQLPRIYGRYCYELIEFTRRGFQMVTSIKNRLKLRRFLISFHFMPTKRSYTYFAVVKNKDITEYVRKNIFDTFDHLDDSPVNYNSGLL